MENSIGARSYGTKRKAVKKNRIIFRYVTVVGNSPLKHVYTTYFGTANGKNPIWSGLGARARQSWRNYRVILPKNRSFEKTPLIFGFFRKNEYFQNFDDFLKSEEKKQFSEKSKIFEFYAKIPSMPNSVSVGFVYI